ncbi:flagellar hook-basal body complex protein FliE [Maricaulaceae bacterium MS644]
MDLAALRAYAAVAQQAGRAGAPNPADEAGQAGAAGAPDFAGMVREAVGSVEATVRGAESMTTAAATGQAEMIDVVTAVAAAEVQLETVIAVRDQVIRAYQEILRMPI